MTPTTSAADILQRTGEQLRLRRVFGDPIQHENVVLVPVAVAIGGGGGGIGPDQRCSGGGLGGIVRGIGAYSLSNDEVRFLPTIDTTALAAMGILAVCLVARAVASATRMKTTGARRVDVRTHG